MYRYTPTPRNYLRVSGVSSPFWGTRNGIISPMTASARIGRPSKGPRELLKIKINPAEKHAAVERARSLGMTLTDYVTLVVSRDTGGALTPEGRPIDAVA